MQQRHRIVNRIRERGHRKGEARERRTANERQTIVAFKKKAGATKENMGAREITTVRERDKLQPEN